MFRVLCVEDDVADREAIQLAVQRAPDLDVEFKRDIAGGMEAIEAAQRKGRPYDAAVLDFMLPMHAGVRDPEERPDESLCNALPLDSDVVHITWYLEDKDLELLRSGDLRAVVDWKQKVILQHLLNHAFTGRSVDVVPKRLDHEWADQVLDKLRRALYSRHVRNGLNRLFGQDSGALPAAARARGGVANPQYELADLKEDIVVGWPYLEKDVKTRVQNVFHTEVEGQQLRRLSLI